MTVVATPPPPAPSTGPLLPRRGDRYRVMAPNNAHAPKLVRDFVATILRVTGHLGLVDDARLCVSEVVGNAYCHTRSRLIRVDAALAARRVTIHVTDDQPDPLPLIAPGPGAESGRGLLIVDRVAARWGATGQGRGTRQTKTVWFVLEDAARAVQAEGGRASGA
ncbi:ATP-binding protein [Streptomyces sp. NPDC005576]|uniref:ATP-binding protein n=1 Tax=unclassified Streptomyces TaxID=2593676 RepID=UPI0033FA3564